MAAARIAGILFALSGALVAGRSTALLAAPRTNAVHPVAHPIHMSSTQIELSRDVRSLEIVVRIFTDDFERAISPAPERPIQIATANAARVDSLITAYFAPRLKFGVNGASMANARVLGHKIDGDATLVSATLPISVALKRLSIEQRIMLDQFADQNNVVRVIVGLKRQSALTRRGVERAELTF